MESTAAPAVVVVTPYSTGCCVAQELQERGYKLVVVWSKGFSEEMKKHVPVACEGKLRYDVVMNEADTVPQTAELVFDHVNRNNWDLKACVCGGEAGVDLNDALSEELGLLSNGTQVENRRDKKVQQELIKKAGLRSIRQAAGKSVDEVRGFLQAESYPVIIKPVDSAGSDGVKLCRSYDEAVQHVQHLLGMTMVNGPVCDEVLCQEFLQGKEYVVDHVSRGGVHKTIMCWVYDKRPVNGADFVYFGDIPIDPMSDEAKMIIPYTRGVLDALGVHNGPSHGEVIITTDGPCLVEMNVRAHGGDGNWRDMQKAMNGGYSQIEAAVDSYVCQKAFDRLPSLPPSPLLASGQCVDLVSFTQGTVKSTPGYDLIRTLPSFVWLETHIKAGSLVHTTVDMATDCGAVVVVNKDPKVLARDIAIIRHLEATNMMFEFCSPDEAEWLQKRERLLAKACSLDFKRRTLSLVGKRTSEIIQPTVLTQTPFDDNKL